MKHAIGYVRVSTEDQDENGLGKQAQIERITKYAEKNGYLILDWKIDGGVSGASEDRPEFNEIVYGEVANPPVEAVLVAASDRVSRDINIYFGYRWLLSKKDIELVSAEMDFGQFGIFSSVIETFVSTMGQMERDSIQMRTSGGRAQKAKRGGYAGGSTPLGYRPQDGQMVIVPEEAETVRRIFEMHDSGRTLREIADVLNEEGRKTKRGKAFNHVTVHVIVNNRPTYEGMYKYGDMNDWVQGQHEPILRGGCERGNEMENRSELSGG